MTTECGSFRGLSRTVDQGITGRASKLAVKCEQFVSMILVRGPVSLGQPEKDAR